MAEKNDNMFSVSIKRFYWLSGNADDSDDLCLHGDVTVNIGSESFETSCTVSSAALYLLKTLTENHAINEENQMLPCCGHFYVPNEVNDTVHITGCISGIDWTVFHTDDGTEIVTAAGKKIHISENKYSKAVFDFADEVRSAYEKCPPKNIPKDDFARRGYVAFWNEWARRRKDDDGKYFCPAVSKKISADLCFEYCFAENGGPTDTAKELKNWINSTHKYKDVKDFHVICGLCTHCQWSK